MIVQLTEKWRKTWLDLFWFCLKIFLACKEAWYNTIYEVDINKTIKEIELYDEETKSRLDPINEKKIKKDMIHTFVWMKSQFINTFWTDNIQKIIDKINITIKWLDSMNNLPN